MSASPGPEGRAGQVEEGLLPPLHRAHCEDGPQAHRRVAGEAQPQTGPYIFAIELPETKLNAKLYGRLSNA